MRDIGSKKRINRVFVFGDSYVDDKRPNGFKKDEGRLSLIHDQNKLWTHQLKNYLQPTQFYNFGKIGRGPRHTIHSINRQNHFRKFEKNDLLLVVFSFQDVPFDNIYEINLIYQKYIQSLPSQVLIFHCYYDIIFEDQNVFPLSLIDISNNEIIAKHADIASRRTDKRINHLSWVNHNILYNCAIQMLSGFNQFEYSDFEYKFLDLDEAYESELREPSQKAFIYD